MKLNAGVITAIAAGAVSLMALAVSIYEAYLMRQQQNAAVWPILEHWTSYSTDEFSIFVANKGLGPAMIRHVGVALDGAPKASWPEAFGSALGDGAVNFSQSMLGGNVMAPNENAMILRYPARHATKAWQASRQITLSVCYCSVFGDCWTYRADDLVNGRPTREPAETCPVETDGQF